jgi:hypothetical protein
MKARMVNGPLDNVYYHQENSKSHRAQEEIYKALLHEKPVVHNLEDTAVIAVDSPVNRLVNIN